LAKVREEIWTWQEIALEKNQVCVATSVEPFGQNTEDMARNLVIPSSLKCAAGLWQSGVLPERIAKSSDEIFNLCVPRYVMSMDTQISNAS
jgi:hypothetical protein